MKHKLLTLLVIAALFLIMLPTTPTHAEDVTIQFWHTYNETSNENKMLVETLIPMFEKAHPGIKVKSVPFPYDNFRQALLTAQAGGEGPDIARLDIIWSPEFANLGALVQLDKALPEFDTFAKAVYPGPLSTNAYKGGYYGLPLDTNTRVWIWGQQLYKDAGITAPPKTIDDVKAQCKAVKALGDDRYVYSDGGTYGWAVLPWIWSFGGDITDKDITKATGYLNSKETVQAYEFLADMVKTGCFAPAMKGGDFDNWKNFFTNKVGSLLEGPWVYPSAAGQYPDFKIQATLMPAGKGGSISVVGGENIVLFANSKHQKEALEFIRFTQSDDYQLKMSETGQLTVKPALLQSDYFKNHPYYPMFLKQLETARARAPHPAWTKMEDILTAAGQKILRGEGTAQETLDAAAKDIDALLAKQ